MGADFDVVLHPGHLQSLFHQAFANFAAHEWAISHTTALIWSKRGFAPTSASQRRLHIYYDVGRTYTTLRTCLKIFGAPSRNTFREDLPVDAERANRELLITEIMQRRATYFDWNNKTPQGFDRLHSHLSFHEIYVPKSSSAQCCVVTFFHDTVMHYIVMSVQVLSILLKVPYLALTVALIAWLIHAPWLCFNVYEHGTNDCTQVQFSSPSKSRLHIHLPELHILEISISELSWNFVFDIHT